MHSPCTSPVWTNDLTAPYASQLLSCLRPGHDHYTPSPMLTCYVQQYACLHYDPVLACILQATDSHPSLAFWALSMNLLHVRMHGTV